MISNIVIRNKLVLRNHFPWPTVNLLHKNKEHLALRNNFRVTIKFFFAKFDFTFFFFLDNSQRKENYRHENTTSKNVLTHCWSMVTTTRYFEGAAAHVKMHSGAKQKLKCLNSNKEDCVFMEIPGKSFIIFRVNWWKKEQHLRNCNDYSEYYD